MMEGEEEFDALLRADQQVVGGDVDGGRMTTRTIGAVEEEGKRQLIIHIQFVECVCVCI